MLESHIEWLQIVDHSDPMKCANKYINCEEQIGLGEMNTKFMPASVTSHSAHWEIWFQYTASCDGRKQATFLQAINKELV